MQSEQQQRVMGYFIEEAKDHLNIIEQGLLSLQSTIENPDMLNEVYRCAHSVKGGAAMLGLDSIQKTAHRLEDCFSDLKKLPVTADQELESLFLQVFDTLQALVEQLQTPFGLTDEVARDIMLDAEPVFEELNTHLGRLVKQAESYSIATAEAPKLASAKAQLNTEDKKMLPVTFKRTVLVELREMLQLFKQQDSPEHRQALQEHCERLRQLSEQLDLPGWGELLETSKAAIAYAPNSYRQLASLVIKEIKQAQELVVTGRSVEIVPSEKLKALVPESPAIESVTASDTQDQEIALRSGPNFTTESSSTEAAEENGNAALISSATDLFNRPDTYIQNPHTYIQEDVREELNEQDFTQHTLGTQDWELETEQDFFQDPIADPQSQNGEINLELRSANASSRPSEPIDPEVGLAELNSLADIFEGQTPDLDQTWQEEEIISLDDKQLLGDPDSLFSLDDQSDFSDLIGDMDGLEISTAEPSTSDDLMDWLNDDSTEEIARPSPESIDSVFSDFDFETTSSLGASTLKSPQTSDLADLLFEAHTPDLHLAEATDTDDLNSLFGDSFFFEENSSLGDNTADFVLDADTSPQLQQQDDDLFVLPAADEFNKADAHDLEEAALSSALSASPDTLDRSADSKDYLKERLTEDENESFDFDNPFVLELEDIGRNESQREETPLAESEFDWSDELELSDREVLSSLRSSKPQKNQALSEELGTNDEATELEFEELTLDESFADFDFTVGEDLAWNGSQSDLASVAAAQQLGNTLPDEFSSRGTDDSLLNWDESELALEDMGSVTLDADDLDFDLDATSTSPFNLDEKSSGDADEGLNLEALEELEVIPDLDTLNDLFDIDSEATNTSAVESPLDFEDLSIFQTSAVTDDFDRPAAASPPASDLETLFVEETPTQTEALDWSAGDLDGLDLAADLFASEASSPEGDFEAEQAQTGEAQAGIFDGEAATLNGPPASDLEALFGDEPPMEIDALEVSQENIFETERPADGELESIGEEAADSWLDLDWEEANAGEATENLDDFLGAEADAVTDAQDWDELLNVAQGLDAPLNATAALSQEWNVEAERDETAAALELDWETTDSEFGSVRDLGLSSSSASSRAQAAVDDDFSFLTTDEDDQALARQSDGLQEFDDLEAMLAEATTLDTSDLGSFESDSLLLGGSFASNKATSGASELADYSPQASAFDELDAMLAEAAVSPASLESPDLEVFEDLEALLGEETPAATEQSPVPVKSGDLEVDTNKNDEFGDLQILLEQAEKTMGGSPTGSANQGQARPLSRPRSRIIEQTMRVPIKHLDSLSNLVGELVVNRNSLEQDQEQLRQFLDNLSHQVLALSDVGARMQDLYERSLLESSLLASRQGHRASLHSGSSQQHHASGVEYDPLEMDRFTGFHLLSQEMIELIVRVRESASDIELLVDGTDQVARMLRQITTQLQEGLTRTRMVPFAQTADRLPRAVREISLKLRKQAELQVEGRETLIDKMILEHLYDPMTHLVNNAITHGIEPPEVRKGAGKPPAGKITVRAFHQGNQTVISISDDGAGIDPERVRQKAIEKRLITPAEALSLTHLELYDFLFRPGFTTKDKADDFSGRGVGMDVVRTSVSEIRGVIHIDSSLGKGTTFTIRLPLTLSICKALCCLSDRASIAFPLDGVEDMLDLPSDRIVTNSEGQTCIQWRDMLLPFQPLSELLTYKRQLSRNTVYGGKREDDMISLVVLRSAGDFLAIQVDKVLGEQEIVIKQLEGPPPKPVGIAGATVLGDGRIMPIADVLELIDLARGRIRKDGGVTIWSREEPHAQVPEELPTAKPDPMVLIVDDSITVRELLSMTFSKAGYRVEQARDGQDAWEKIRSGLPCDIVFCDIEMPRMDGLELLSRLQKDENLRHLPIAMLTSRGADRHRQMASQLGARGYFTKPYLEEVLLDAAQRMIKGEVLFSSSNA